MAHTFSFARMGLQLQWMWVNGNRLESAAYDVGRYDAQIPFAKKHAVSFMPDKHNQHWMQLTLFAEFEG